MITTAYQAAMQAKAQRGGFGGTATTADRKPHTQGVQGRHAEAVLDYHEQQAEHHTNEANAHTNHAVAADKAGHPDLARAHRAVANYHAGMGSYHDDQYEGGARNIKPRKQPDVDLHATGGHAPGQDYRPDSATPEDFYA